MKLSRGQLPLVAALISGLIGGVIIGSTNRSEVPGIGEAKVPFFAVNQAGIETSSQAHALILAFNLKDGITKDGVNRLMRVWSSDAANLTQGRAIIGDSAAEMAENPARLTITFGFGFSMYEKLDITKKWSIKVKSIPNYSIDRLEEHWSDGDLLVQINGDDPLSVFHAGQEIERDGSPFVEVRWQQRGFLNSAGVNTGNIGRNLMGQIDGQVNAAPGSKEFAETAWDSNGGTTMVIRRIRMNLETWNQLSPNRKSGVIGRTLANGAPLSGGEPSSPVDPSKLDASGETTISKDAHAGRAQAKSNQGIFRRGFNYDDGYLKSGIRDAGLIFISYQESIERYLKIQERLNSMDSLNIWTTPVGSALFYIPRGILTGPDENNWVGKEILN